MLNNGNKTNCGFADEIVSYIYDEIGQAERTQFETHLADCTVCTDEFATISNARFSVFEWRREEFAHLTTPEIVIPYAAKQTVEESSSVGLLAGLREWLSLVNIPVTVAAALAVSVGLGFLAITYLGPVDQQMVADVNVPVVVTQDDKGPIGSTEHPMPVSTKTIEVGETTHSKDVATSREIRPVKAVAARRTRLERQMTANSILVQDPALKLRKAPVLSTYDDNDDRSLRLTDLFDEDGG